MRIKVNVAELPSPPYPEAKTKRRKSIEIPKDARIVRLDPASSIPRVVQPKKRRERRRKDMWTPEDEKKAMDMYWDGAGFEDIAKALGRTLKATRTKVHILRRMQGRRPRPEPNNPHNNAWQPEEDEILIKMWNDGATAIEISKELRVRSRSAVNMRLNLLRNKTDFHIRYGKGRP